MLQYYSCVFCPRNGPGAHRGPLQLKPGCTDHGITYYADNASKSVGPHIEIFSHRNRIYEHSTKRKNPSTSAITAPYSWACAYCSSPAPYSHCIIAQYVPPSSTLHHHAEVLLLKHRNDSVSPRRDRFDSGGMGRSKPGEQPNMTTWRLLALQHGRLKRLIRTF